MDKLYFVNKSLYGTCKTSTPVTLVVRLDFNWKSCNHKESPSSLLVGETVDSGHRFGLKD
jgi:hypothetical protein